jgi:tetratricopeptide (TPR) repeat protein/tRNA A-37 threonylcarbamoyl transferase component Bud32
MTPPTQSQPTHAAGDRFGRYVIVGEAGRGAMGAVHAAYDTTLNRKVALKLLRNGGADAIARLLAEASVLAKLNHPNVVRAYDFGVVDGEPFLAMELVEGQTLSDWRKGDADDPARAGRSVRAIATTMAAVARGLAAAHAAGIIHRDVKPDNILVAGPRVLVTDFGLSVPAKAVADGAAGAPVAQARRSITGTADYMAPEQWRGEPVDIRTDVFAFGVTLYQMLYGVLPFQGDTLVEKFDTVIAGRITPPPAGHQVPARLHRLALRCLARDPAGRPSDLNGVAAALLADPAVARRRTGLAAFAMVAAAAAFWGGARLKARPERRCQAGAAVIDGAWNEGRKTALGRLYQAVDESAAWAALRDRLDRYVEAWRAMHAETCSATFSQRRQSEALLDLRMVCLDGRRAALDAFVSGLNGASPAQLVTAAGSRLPDLAACGSTGHAGTKPLPSDPGERAQVVAIEADLGRARASLIMANYTRAQAEVDRALTAARKLGYEPALAHALSESAKIESRRARAEAEPDPAPAPAAPGQPVVTKEQKFLEEAIQVADRGGDDLHRVRAASELTIAYAVGDRLREAELWAQLASSLMERIGNPDGERFMLDLNLGWLRFLRGDRAAAKAKFNQAFALAVKTVGADDPAAMPSRIASCKVQDGRDKKLACLHDALAVAQRVFGPKHADVAVIYQEIAGVLMLQERTHAEGCDLLKKGLAIERAVLAPNHPTILLSIAGVASCLSEENKATEARPYHEYLLAHVTRPGSRRAQVRLNFGNFLNRLVGDRDGAVKYMTLALEDSRQVFGDADEHVVRIRSGLAQTLHEMGQSAAMLAQVDAAIAACAASAATPPNLVIMHVLRAQALVSLKRYREAEAAAHEALAMYRESNEPELQQINALGVLGNIQWLEGHLDKAQATYERSLALLNTDEDEHDAQAQMSYRVAQMMVERTPRGRAFDPRACVLAKRAVEGLRKADKTWANHLREAEAFWASPRLKPCRSRS